MITKELNPKLALNKAFLKIKPNRNEIELFKSNLITLLDKLKTVEERPKDESEEHLKNDIRDFLRDTFYKDTNAINTKDKKDLVIHTSKDTNSKVGVIIEAKRPSNKGEMLSKDNLNKKALQELVLYYLRERITHKNLEVKHLIVTNINEWYIFDEHLFERLFTKKELVKQFESFEFGKKSTSVFYKEIAEPFIQSITNEIEYTYFNLKDYESVLRNQDKKDDKQLIELFKLLSPPHLLKLPFNNDSNSLDKNFYGELLHLIGLVEVKEGSKKLIQRPELKDRNSGSLLENTINQLDSLDKLSRLTNLKQYGETQEERLFNVGLELCITWVNRILFLKLLEAQLISYHKGDKSYSFLNFDKIHDYDNLNSLFFMVLARKPEDRNQRVKDLFSKVPYLNSSLFEPTVLEHEALFISGLEDNIVLPFLSSTVIKDNHGNKEKGSREGLRYLFDFLSSYDFTSDGSEDIQEDNKTLINASVLGLIFEKINGYKDGSFYTPGFITQYMCRETIRRAVIQKFNEIKSWDCTDFNELHNKISDKKESNSIVNQIKICDPGVGSGHYLVSALNEIIAIKKDLDILIDRNGKSLTWYNIEVVNDELIVTDSDGDFFEYNPLNKESQRIQETLFHEKQTIIENCLFGVDINPNSVKICRLRLWIELLKNAYYKTPNELETLPNIDINIKCGNSLVSRFAVDTDMKEIMKKSKWSIDEYKKAVDTYRNAESKDQKREMEVLINDIKTDFRTEIGHNSKEQRDLIKFGEELYQKYTAPKLFDDPISSTLKKKQEKEKKELENKVANLKKTIEEIKSNKIYENAFEWRFEFPEVLNNEGEFIGFDVIIGNPPYGADLDIKSKELFKSSFSDVHMRTPDTFNYFISMSLRLLKKDGFNSFIVPNNLLFQNEYELTRTLISQRYFLEFAFNLGDNIFEDAQVPTAIYLLQNKQVNSYDICFADYRNWNKNPDYLFQKSLINHINNGDLVKVPGLTFGVNQNSVIFLEKIQKLSYTIDDIAHEMASGISTGSDKVFRLSNSFVEENHLESNLIRPVLVGGEIDKYSIQYKEYSLIYTSRDLNEQMFPKSFLYLKKFEDKLKLRSECKTGILPWFSLGRQRYPELFEKNKIILRQTSDSIRATYDDSGFYVLNSILVLQLKVNIGYSYNFVLGVLNSKLCNYFYQLFSQELGRTFAEVKPKNVRKLYIPKINSKDQMKIESLVKTILENKKNDPNYDSKDLEIEIDRELYSIYNLSPEEIAIIEGK
jgi:adenine-specific DNA-methyltransferase